MDNNIFIVNNDEDLRDGLKKWFCEYQKQPEDFVLIEFRVKDNLKIEKFSANGFNNLLTVVCALYQTNPNIKIFVQLISNDIIEMINENNLSEKLKKGLRQLLIFFQSLNLIDMLLKLGVVIRPSDEGLQNIIQKLDAKKEERVSMYSSKILCLNPLINNSQEQYNLTYRMKTLISILYWQLKSRINFKEIEEASGQIMFELVKNIYQHSGIKNDLMINGFTCAQLNLLPIVTFNSTDKENKYTEATFLTLSQKDEYSFALNKNNWGSFISITVNDFGVGIHSKVLENYPDISIKDAIMMAFTTNFSSKVLEYEEFWRVNNNVDKIPLEHKGFGLIYCLMFVFKNLGRIKICSKNVEIKLFTKLEAWMRESMWCTPVDFLGLIKAKGYVDLFEMEVKELEYGDFVGTQILIEIPTYNMYKGK